MRKILLLCFPVLLFSQNSLNPRVNNFIDSLDDSINYFFVEETHPGITLMTQDIQYECFNENYYIFTKVFWKDNSENYFEKTFYRCSETKPTLTSSDYFDFVISNFEIIKNEEVLPYQTEPDRVEDGKTIKSLYIKNHRAIRNYIFRKDGNIFSKKFDAYFLTTKGDNINFETNRKLKLAELDGKLINLEK